MFFWPHLASQGTSRSLPSLPLPSLAVYRASVLTALLSSIHLARHMLHFYMLHPFSFYCFILFSSLQLWAVCTLQQRGPERASCWPRGAQLVVGEARIQAQIDFAPKLMPESLSLSPASVLLSQFPFRSSRTDCIPCSLLREPKLHKSRTPKRCV